MNKTILASALGLSLGLGSLGLGSLGLGSVALAQSPPVGGADAKGNAPLKHMHTVNDGSARPGANSFTEGQARQHIVNSGYADVSGLTKGQDGVWRGTATHNGAQVNVAMDFKGNVTEAGAGAMTPGSATTATSSTTTGNDAGAMGAGAAGGAAMMHHHHHHIMRHHHDHGRCANPGPNGAACSGIDTNGHGVSDKEEHAIQSGAHP